MHFNLKSQTTNRHDFIVFQNRCYYLTSRWRNLTVAQITVKPNYVIVTSNALHHSHFRFRLEREWTRRKRRTAPAPRLPIGRNGANSSRPNQSTPIPWNSPACNSKDKFSGTFYVKDRSTTSKSKKIPKKSAFLLPTDTFNQTTKVGEEKLGPGKGLFDRTVPDPVSVPGGPKRGAGLYFRRRGWNKIIFLILNFYIKL